MASEDDVVTVYEEQASLFSEGGTSDDGQLEMQEAETDSGQSGTGSAQPSVVSQGAGEESGLLNWLRQLPVTEQSGSPGTVEHEVSPNSRLWRVRRLRNLQSPGLTQRTPDWRLKCRVCHSVAPGPSTCSSIKGLGQDPRLYYVARYCCPGCTRRHVRRAMVRCPMKNQAAPSNNVALQHAMRPSPQQLYKKGEIQVLLNQLDMQQRMRKRVEQENDVLKKENDCLKKIFKEACGRMFTGEADRK